MKDELISLAHGNGGRKMQQLISEVFAPAFGNKTLDTSKDAVPLEIHGQAVITTDGFTVDPLFFPGGDIGKLSVCGTLNDLLVSGALPLYLTANFFIEEGFPVAQLRTIASSMGQTARDNQVSIVAGDTKVLPRGNVAGLYIATTGIGQMKNPHLGLSQIQAGDKVFVSGPIGDHGAAVMLSREDFGLSGELESDCASLKMLIDSLIEIADLKFMRDPTRGGLASVCHEIIKASGLGIKLQQSDVPIRAQVSTACEILGYDPYYLACEGRVVFICSGQTDALALQQIDQDIREIGLIEDSHQQLLLQTPIGGLRILTELDDDALPRIC